MSLKTSEIPLIPDSDVEALRSFHGRGHSALSAYLRLDTDVRREAAHETFVLKMREHLSECNPKPECREAIKEDMEIVGLYLKTNGLRHRPGLAIFSCAAEFFWRAYPLPVALPTHVTVGPQFNVEPLMRILEGEAKEG
jgi:hypothetical protein